MTINVGGASASVGTPAIPPNRETAIRLTYRHPLPAVPTDLSYIVTPSVSPYQRSDGLIAITGWDDHWLIVGEDGQCHVIRKQDLSTFRADREPNWTTSEPWNVGMATKVAGFSLTNDSPNAFFVGVARETWTYTDTAINVTKTTGYAIIMGTGDYDGAKYRPPTLFFYREGQAAAQSLTTMLDAQGIMGADYTAPECLSGATRVAVDTFYLFGSGANQSTNAAPSRPTFGKLVLTLNGAKTETAGTAVSSLTWTSYLSVLQGVMPAGETIVNVPAAGGLTGNTLHVMCVTQDAGSVLRSRLVQFDVSALTATLDARTDVLSNIIFPISNSNMRTDQAARIARGSGGVIFSVGKGGGLVASYYMKDTDTKWRSISNQITRCLGANGMGVACIAWDGSKSRWVVAGGGGAAALAGWLDADCKQGHPFTAALPVACRWPGDGIRSAKGIYADSQGAVLVGVRQLIMLIPSNSVESSPTRVLWGLRVTPTVVNDQVNVSEGEALIFQWNAPSKRVYFPGGTLGGFTSVGGVTYTLVLTSTGVIQRPGSGLASGTDFPEPALALQVVLANITRAASAVPVTTGEIDQATYRDM